MDWYVGNEWQLKPKGLHKKVLDLDFTKLEKPQLVGKVIIKVENIGNLDGRTTNYLVAEEQGKQQMMEMGTARNPIDCYLELLVQQMIVGEKSKCSIGTTKTGGVPITFDMTLVQILSGIEIHKLSVSEMYNLAMRYKENGVAMFKTYPKFAHDYFARAAKCLISYKPFDNLTKTADGIEVGDLQALFVQIQTNLAACLLAEKRYEDAIYQTEFVETIPDPSEKSVYRRALGFYHTKEYEKALKTIERMPKYEDKREFTKLKDNITTSMKDSNAHYKQVVQRMFS